VRYLVHQKKQNITIFVTSNSVTAAVTVWTKVSDDRFTVKHRRDAAAHRAVDVTHFVGVTHPCDAAKSWIVGVIAGDVDVIPSVSCSRAVDWVVTRERTLGLAREKFKDVMQWGSITH